MYDTYWVLRMVMEAVPDKYNAPPSFPKENEHVVRYDYETKKQQNEPTRWPLSR